MRCVWVNQRCKGWWDNQMQQRQEAHERKEVLDQLIAAYRQYHTAAGSYFVKRRLSAKKARRLLVRKDGWFGRRFSGWAYDLWRSRHILSVSDVGMLFPLPPPPPLPLLTLPNRL